MDDEHWFDVATDDPGETARRARELRQEDTGDLPGDAVRQGAFETEDDYYQALHDVLLALGELRLDELRSMDSDLVNAVRTLDELDDAGGRLSQRLEEWREDGEPRPEVEGALDTVDTARDDLETWIEDEARSVAPNLSAMAGPVLAARLVSLAGGLKNLARMPSGTLQVLGAEDALFRHLRDGSPPPKHGVIYLHPYVRGTAEEDRGSAARTFAGKLSIAARVDHYSGDLRPELVEDIERKMQEIQGRER
ncbi:MAG: NOP5/NOP56 family protein [Halobacteriota archaeon]